VKFLSASSAVLPSVAALEGRELEPMALMLWLAGMVMLLCMLESHESWQVNLKASAR
jgi:hypothetical protein